MIVVEPEGDKWFWYMISSEGRILLTGLERFDTQMAAFHAAKAYRTTFWELANFIDHRMGACI